MQVLPSQQPPMPVWPHIIGLQVQPLAVHSCPVPQTIPLHVHLPFVQVFDVVVTQLVHISPELPQSLAF
jgi:hypothetical protein